MSAFRTLLEEGDITGLRDAWGRLFPHLPQPASREEAEVAMHHARTQADSIAFKLRAWSHRWLCERELPSGLPDSLKPKAERLYPVVCEGVGISVNTRSQWMRPAVGEVRRAMEDAVSDAYADGKRDPVFVTARMQEAKARTMRALFGGLG